jgi:glycosyltransferase involved in cell wall biosynthesis
VSPRISVLLPVHDAAATLPACLESVFRQTERAWECIVVDDGSTDRSRAMAEEAARRDARVRVMARPHRGLVAALNDGLAVCRGLLVARMDADDLMHRDRLRLQAEALDADPALAAIGCHVRLFPRSGLTARRREYEAWLNGLQSADDVRRDAFVECPVAHPTLMMRRTVTVMGYVERGWPEDYDLVLRALEAGLRIGVVPRRLLAWRDHPRRLSRTHASYAQARFTACKAHYLARGLLAARDEYVLWGYGSTGRLLRRALATEGKRVSHVIEIKSTRIGQRIHAAPVVPIDALPSLHGRPIVVSVARDGPRREIRSVLRRHAFVEGRDFVCAA